MFGKLGGRSRKHDAAVVEHIGSVGRRKTGHGLLDQQHAGALTPLVVTSSLRVPRDYPSRCSD